MAAADSDIRYHGNVVDANVGLIISVSWTCYNGPWESRYWETATAGVTSNWGRGSQGPWRVYWGDEEGCAVWSVHIGGCGNHRTSVARCTRRSCHVTGRRRGHLAEIITTSVICWRLILHSPPAVYRRRKFLSAVSPQFP